MHLLDSYASLTAAFFKAFWVSEALIKSSEQNTRTAPPGLEVTSHTSQEMAYPTKSHPPPKHTAEVTRHY